MQLLQINVTPVKYELQIEHAKLELDQEFHPQSNTTTTPSKIQVKSTPTMVQLDTYEARHSIGFAKVGDLISQASDKGKAALTNYIKNTIETGTAIGKIEDGVTINQIFRQKLLESPGTYTAFLPSHGADISWQPGSLDINFTKGSLRNDWQTSKASMNYIPGDVSMQIIQYGNVQIEYIGGPLYVPPSAAPDYQKSSVD